MIKIITTIILSIFFIGCGGDTKKSNTLNKYNDGNYTKVSLSGQITYDLVPANPNHLGLDYDSIRHEPSRWITLEAIDDHNILIEKTSTDLSGHYHFNKIPINTKVKIRILALINKNGIAKVVDNTKNNSLYVVDGSLVDSGSKNTSRDINIPSGWMGANYNSIRSAAPFAILGSVQKAMKLVIDASPSVSFSNLNINWSKNNIAYSGDASSGKIGTSHYINNNLYILGDENGDTDEYDDHVIAHEWGHYYIDKLSRSDSIGGAHGLGEFLDIRVAFSEGFGNAFSAMAHHNPIYFDSMFEGQSSGMKMDIEHGTESNPGWFSEASVQHILYDLFDDNQDSADTINLGFKPLHQVFTNQQKDALSFTSIFSFITYLKTNHQEISTGIDALLESENIATIGDIYGHGRNNHMDYYPYNTMTVGETANITIRKSFGTKNKLGNRHYVKFNIPSQGQYKIKIMQTSGSENSAVSILFKAEPKFERLGYSSKTTRVIILNPGNYLLEVYDKNKYSSSEASYNITISAN